MKLKRSSLIMKTRNKVMTVSVSELCNNKILDIYATQYVKLSVALKKRLML